MLRTAGGTARRIARGAVIGVGTASAVTGAAATVYAYSEQGLGFRRELQFWGVVSPIVLDYWWHSSSSSPYVRYQKLVHPPPETTNEFEENAADGDTTIPTNKNATRDSKYKELHERNAPRIFHVMLDLGGLYIKLGQVLSVTALPIPEQYRELFRTLQSSVPGHAEFEAVVKPMLENELGKQRFEELFETVEEIPCGAASIGQAHKAVLRETGEEVIIKVQYPNAQWQVPADIQCVGDFLQLCVYFGVIDESASKLSYQEFARQFLAELDYDNERENLQAVYESSLDPNAPYRKHGVLVPRVFPDLCTNRVITMTYLPGPKFEEEAKRQLELVGINMKRDIRDVVQAATKNDVSTGRSVGAGVDEGGPVILSTAAEGMTQWQLQLTRIVGKWVGVDAFLSMLRVAHKLVLWSRVATVYTIHVASSLSLAPSDWEAWAKEHENAALQVARLDWTHKAVYALLDVHGYQIFNQGLFNADPHPGNLLIVQDESKESFKSSEPKIGLIDFGQCKRLTPDERVKVARLLLSVADNAPDDKIAAHFRDLGIQTQNDSPRFLADFARLMFGSFKPEHLDHSWHKELHKEDKVLYFPNELSMVYRTSLLLRGLAMTLQLNVAIGEHWRHHAQSAIEAEYSPNIGTSL